MRINRNVVAGMGAVATAAILAACADSPTSPAARTAFVPKTSFAVGDARVFGNPVATELVVCKSGDVSGLVTIVNAFAGQGGTGNPTIIADQDAGTAGNQFTLAPGAGGATNCVLAVEDLGDAFFERGDFFTVSEAPTAGVTTTTTCYINDGNTTPDACPANFFINTAHGWTVVFHNVQEPTGGEGCTPGYWKQEQHFGSWPFGTGTAFNSIFVGSSYTGSFLQAVNLTGGLNNQLIRHAAAAYLNAANPDVDYEYTVDEIKAIFFGTGAYSGMSVEERKDLLAAANEAGCPLGRDEG